MLLRIFLLLLFAQLLCTGVKAQQNNGCIDSTLIRYGYSCPTDFEPLCGCNNITYRNLCFAQNEGVIQYSSGPCEPVVIDFNPNPASDMIYGKVVLKQEDSFNFMIYDYRGNQYYFQSFGVTKELAFNIDVNTYPLGVYMIIIQTGNGDHTWAKLVKFNR